MLRELSANVDDYHAVVYAQPSTDRRVRLEDEQSISFVVQALGEEAARRTVVALTYANELEATRVDKEEVIEVKAKQVGELFDAAVAMVGGGGGGGGGQRRGGEASDASTSSSSLSASAGWGIPAVAVGAGGDGTGWESTLWIALMRRAKAAADAAGLKPPADAQSFSVDWDGLRAAGVVTESKPPPPPPPLELVRAYVDTALGEFDNSGTKGRGRGQVVDELVERSVFTVKQRGMPPGFAATIILEVRGPLDRGDNQLCMLMPGTAKNTMMKVRMGSVPPEDLPSPAALRRGGTEVTVGALSTNGGGGGGFSGPVTYTFDPSDGSFTAGMIGTLGGGGGGNLRDSLSSRDGGRLGLGDYWRAGKHFAPTSTTDGITRIAIHGFEYTHVPRDFKQLVQYSFTVLQRSILKRGTCVWLRSFPKASHPPKMYWRRTKRLPGRDSARDAWWKSMKSLEALLREMAVSAALQSCW